MRPSSGRTRNDREAAALAKYREAADAYQFLLRLRALDFEAVNGRVLLAGTNLEAAMRYGLALEDVQTDGTLGRYGWSGSAAALKSLFEIAPRTIAEADRLVNGE